MSYSTMTREQQGGTLQSYAGHHHYEHHVTSSTAQTHVGLTSQTLGFCIIALIIVFVLVFFVIFFSSWLCARARSIRGRNQFIQCFSAIHLQLGLVTAAATNRMIQPVAGYRCTTSTGAPIVLHSRQAVHARVANDNSSTSPAQQKTYSFHGGHPQPARGSGRAHSPAAKRFPTETYWRPGYVFSEAKNSLMVSSEFITSIAPLQQRHRATHASIRKMVKITFVSYPLGTLGIMQAVMLTRT